MAEFGELVLLHLLEEKERREVYRNANLQQRQLRDSAKPFEMAEVNFIQFFRLSKYAARRIIEDISPHLPPTQRITGIPAHLKVLTALNFYAMGSYQKNVGSAMLSGAMSQSAISRCVKDVTQVIFDCLTHVWIQFPTEEQVYRVKERFLQRFQMPGVIGCIDATHVAIISPSVEDPIYLAIAYNRKGFYSLNVQIISDVDLQIRSIHARCPGSTHDSTIWNGSMIKQHLHERFNLHNTKEWLLGDAGYPLQPFLLTPILHAPDDTPEERYTTRHKRVCNSVERAIGILKQRFRCLLKHRVLHYRSTTASKIIYACALLHNICRFYNVQLPNCDAEFLYNEPIDVHNEENVISISSVLTCEI